MITTMKCQRINPLNSDNGICDAARVSMAKEASGFTKEQNGKLIGYLCANKHWSPFGHAREIFHFNISDADWTYFLERANTAGFTWERSDKLVFLSGSVWAYYENMSFLPPPVADGIRWWFHNAAKYELTAPLLFRRPRAADWGGRVFNVTPKDIREFARLTVATFRITAPIFVARQLVKHQIDLCWNEESRRYIDDAPEFFLPDVWRARPDKSIKQGSSQTAVSLSEDVTRRAQRAFTSALGDYNLFLEADVAPELARMVLPQSAMTQWIWTGTIAAFRRVCDLRLDPHAQVETRQIAKIIDARLSEYAPVAWESLKKSPEYIERG